jgi:hypothetical protein
MPRFLRHKAAVSALHVRRYLPHLPALLDLGMTTSRPTQRPTATRLLGKYPVPALHLVGTDPPPDLRTPTRWHPAQPPLQHGVDYTFARWYGLTPVRWQLGTVITVRMTCGASSLPSVKGPADAVNAVVAELRQLTGLDLRAGPALERPIDIRRIPEHEIHVAYLPSAEAQQVCQLAGDRRPSGDAVSIQDRPWYQYGWAIVDTDLAIESFAVLRHQLGHALGLGHAASRQVLMHQRIPADLAGYSRGDRRGLALLGDARPVQHDPLPHSHMRGAFHAAE